MASDDALDPLDAACRRINGRPCPLCGAAAPFDVLDQPGWIVFGPTRPSALRRVAWFRCRHCSFLAPLDLAVAAGDTGGPDADP